MIRDLAGLIADAADFEGEIVWDSSRPDGQMKRGLDVSRARELVGFEAEVPLEQGIERCGTKSGNRGWDAAQSAIEMANLYKEGLN